ncbi:hypothetical protein AUK40_02820 [Candidatus Wirthbacteria bacterium CG2_30_54_11]|uniref:5'-deoxynucleotidase n=1 Tax=Candidatus Wirthbacteria bacterium CG2_30_54_11 TaxID=1817892 RepID=A0A1J5J253_9BACT|nr:MAG: hypothetical protein AUK40_02820 [Candidatus Wirthbacteria bacterium CG2_30_54_11]
MKSPALVFLDEIENLKLVPRTGYQNHSIPQVESVAEHSFAVAWYAWLLAEEEHADVPRVIKMALMHDAGESRIGDLTLGAVEEYIGREVKRTAEFKAVMDMASELSEELEQHLIALFSEFSEGATLESRIVGDADALQMLGQVLRYEQVYRVDLSDFWMHTGAREWLPAARAWYEELVASHEALDHT